MSVTDLIHFDKEGEPVRNEWFKRLYLSLIIILVATLSFGVGRLTAVPRGEGIKMEYDPSLSAGSLEPTARSTQTASVVQALPSDASGVIGSKNGSKYHYSYCPGAKQIKETNRITFNTASEAEGAGYSLAGNCKPR